MKVKIDDIKMGKRIREDLGDLTALQESINTLGLFNPININQNYELLAGARRLTACRNLGWRDIDVSIITTSGDLAKLEIESQENFMRKDFTEHEIEKIIERKRRLAKKGFLYSIAQLFKYLFSMISSFFVKLLGKKQLPPLDQ